MVIVQAGGNALLIVDTRRGNIDRSQHTVQALQIFSHAAGMKVVYLPQWITKVCDSRSKS
jgi:hypothetical protein